MVMRVIKPRPPSWIIIMMMICPKRLHWTQVSTVMSPVTQVAEVAVNSASKKPTLIPLREAMGRVSSSAPSRMMHPKDAATLITAK